MRSNIHPVFYTLLIVKETMLFPTTTSTKMINTATRRLVGASFRCSNRPSVSWSKLSRPVASPILPSLWTRPLSSTTERPFAILGVQQIAIGALERDSLHRLWYDIFGLRPSQAGITMPKENVSEDIVTLGGTGPETAIEIDLMTPIDPDASPKVHLPPLNHIGLWVDDLPKAVEYMTQRGVRFTPGGIRPGAAGYDVIFIHPKGNDNAPIGGNGVLIELVQAPANVIRALSCSTAAGGEGGVAS